MGADSQGAGADAEAVADFGHAEAAELVELDDLALGWREAVDRGANHAGALVGGLFGDAGVFRGRALGGGTHAFDLSAGDQLRMSPVAAVGVSQVVERERDAFSPFSPDWAWVESLAGAPQVEGQTLVAFLDWVANETGREVRFDTPLTETRARGVVLHGDAAALSPLEALEVVLSTTDFTYALRDDGAIEVSLRTQ